MVNQLKVVLRFYQQPILIPLIAVLAFTVFIGAAGTIHHTLITKRLDFKTLMKIGLISTVVSGGVGIALAWQGFGVWSLAAQTLVASFAATLLQLVQIIGGRCAISFIGVVDLFLQVLLFFFYFLFSDVFITGIDLFLQAVWAAV